MLCFAVNFVGKHELRQVYIRSTARVYEIYCAPDLKTTGEYLCTVRCGVAVRDGHVLRCNSIESLPNRDSSDESVKCEDDWVEVKVADTSDHATQVWFAVADSTLLFIPNKFEDDGIIANVGYFLSPETIRH